MLIREDWKPLLSAWFTLASIAFGIGVAAFMALLASKHRNRLWRDISIGDFPDIVFGGSKQHKRVLSILLFFTGMQAATGPFGWWLIPIVKNKQPVVLVPDDALCGKPGIGEGSWQLLQQAGRRVQAKSNSSLKTSLDPRLEVQLQSVGLGQATQTVTKVSLGNGDGFEDMPSTSWPYMRWNVSYPNVSFELEYSLASVDVSLNGRLLYSFTSGPSYYSLVIPVADAQRYIEVNFVLPPSSTKLANITDLSSLEFDCVSEQDKGALPGDLNILKVISKDTRLWQPISILKVRIWHVNKGLIKVPLPSGEQMVWWSNTGLVMARTLASGNGEGSVARGFPGMGVALQAPTLGLKDDSGDITEGTNRGEALGWRERFGIVSYFYLTEYPFEQLCLYYNLGLVSNLILSKEQLYYDVPTALAVMYIAIPIIAGLLWLCEKYLANHLYSASMIKVIISQLDGVNCAQPSKVKVTELVPSLDASTKHIYLSLHTGCRASEHHAKYLKEGFQGFKSMDTL